jgi:hypothetical protein
VRTGAASRALPTRDINTGRAPGPWRRSERSCERRLAAFRGPGTRSLGADVRRRAPALALVKEMIVLRDACQVREGHECCDAASSDQVVCIRVLRDAVTASPRGAAAPPRSKPVLVLGGSESDGDRRYDDRVHRSCVGTAVAASAGGDPFCRESVSSVARLRCTSRTNLAAGSAARRHVSRPSTAPAGSRSSRSASPEL